MNIYRDRSITRTMTITLTSHINSNNGNQKGIKYYFQNIKRKELSTCYCEPCETIFEKLGQNKSISGSTIKLTTNTFSKGTSRNCTSGKRKMIPNMQASTVKKGIGTYVNK